MALPSADLLTDVFRFLTFLHANDVRPSHSRFLTFTTLEKLNATLLHPDDLHIPTPRPRRGKRGATERETERIRLIHFLCEAAQLVALTGRFLKPTPRVARWLALSTLEQTRALFDSGFLARHRRSEELWHVYRLPGFRLGAPEHILAPLLAIFRALPLDAHVSLITLGKMIPLETLDDSSDHQPLTILRAILRYLEWLGVVQAKATPSFRLTALGAHLLDLPDAPALPRDPTPQPLVLHSDLTLRIPRQPNLPILYELSNYASPVSVKRGREQVWELDRARIQSALARGATYASLVHLLEAATQDALPRPVLETLQTWGQELERVTIRRLTILETRDRTTMEQLTRVRGIRAHIRRTLSPRAVTLHVDGLPALIRQLNRLGYPPRLELPQPNDRAARQPFDDPTMAHLYLAARIGHILPEWIAAPYRVPYSIVLELEKQLSEHDRDIALQTIEMMIADRRPPLGAQHAQPYEPLAGKSLQAAVETIERALDDGTLLTITYSAASRGETTTRVVEPLRIEWRGNIPYLIAFCHLRQDERVFRVERILEMTTPPRSTPVAARGA